jgi:quinoprotein glucose dehydrogenase
MGINDPGPVGSFGRNGPLLTSSLLFVAQLDGSRALIRSYNKQTGAVISQLNLPLPPMGTPMSYMINGKQFIVLAVGAGPDTRLLGLGLPD